MADYDVAKATKFNRDKLQAAIPQKLQELMSSVGNKKNANEIWYVDVVTKILRSVHRICNDLLKTMDQEALSAAAWNARNLLELWIWIKYCATSEANARRFHEDTLRDMEGLVDALSQLHEIRDLTYQYEATSRQKIAEIAHEKLGLNSLDGAYARVSNAATLVGQEQWFSANNKFLSKFTHPTAGLVLGIMHQTEKLQHLQATITTSGVYFAGQCVIGLDDIVSAMKA